MWYKEKQDSLLVAKDRYWEICAPVLYRRMNGGEALNIDKE